MQSLISATLSVAKWRPRDLLWYKRGVRYVSFFGNESLLHPPLTDMIEMSLQEIWVLRSLQTPDCSPCSWTTRSGRSYQNAPRPR